MKKFLRDVNDELEKAGAPPINEAGQKFLTDIVEGGGGDYTDSIFSGIYLNTFPPRRDDRVWSVEDNSSHKIEIHVASGVVCAYLHDQNIGTLSF